MRANSEISSDLERVLASDEELLWHGEPDRRSHVVGWLVSAIPLVVFFGPLVFIPTMFVVFVVGIAIDAGLLYLAVGFLFVTVFTLSVVFGGCYLLAVRAHEYAEYAVTDRRLLCFGGLVGRDYSTVEWANVEDFEVNVGVVDDRYDTDSVSAITAGSGGVTFSSILDPYGVLDTIESARRRTPRE